MLLKPIVDTAPFFLFVSLCPRTWAVLCRRHHWQQQQRRRPLPLALVAVSISFFLSLSLPQCSCSFPPPSCKLTIGTKTKQNPAAEKREGGKTEEQGRESPGRKGRGALLVLDRSASKALPRDLHPGVLAFMEELVDAFLDDMLEVDPSPQSSFSCSSRTRMRMRTKKHPRIHAPRQARLERER